MATTRCTPVQPRAAGSRYRVVIAGGGVAALEAMLALRALAEDRVTIDLLSPEREFVYRPLAVAEPFELGHVARFDLAELVRQGGAVHHPDALVAVDAERKRVRTRGGAELHYDALLLAVGARHHDPIPGALTFGGRSGVKQFGRLLDEIENRTVARVAFALPGGVTWGLPLYELALMTANHLRLRGLAEARLRLVTPEERPLGIFGRRASSAVRSRLERSGIGLRTGAHPTVYEDGQLRLVPRGGVHADRVVTLPILVGPRLPGLPADDDGFLPTDTHGQVDWVDSVYAAGDVTSFPVKQGGIAAQQALAAAQAIAAAAGALVTPVPFKPVLRGLLLTGATPAYLRTPISGGQGEATDIAVEPLWWPPAKIAAKHLSPFLALRAEGALPPQGTADALAVAREFDQETREWHALEGTEAQPVRAEPLRTRTSPIGTN